MSRRKSWSLIVEEMGQQVRVYERSPGSVLYRSVVIGNSKDRKSLGHRDRKLAEQQARALARELAELQLRGHAPGAPITLGQLRKLYLHHRGPLLSEDRQRDVSRSLGLWTSHLGVDFAVQDFSEHHLETYLHARRSGKLMAPDPQRAKTRPADGTLRNELRVLSTVCNWAGTFRVNGRPLLGSNPVRGITPPQEKNPARPRMSEDRYKKLLKVAYDVDASGALFTLIELAWHTGRRINAMLHLRASDVLTTPEAMRPVLAACGMDEGDADHWPAALHWRPEHDKKGYRDVSPISEKMRDILVAYIQRQGVIGEGWIFPAPRNPAQPMTKYAARYYLQLAEKEAGLPRINRLGWHGFRRAWATRRKNLPLADVMRAGGWRDVAALQEAYSQADARTTLRVVEHGA